MRKHPTFARFRAGVPHRSLPDAKNGVGAKNLGMREIAQTHSQIQTQTQSHSNSLRLSSSFQPVVS
jgi:hypothetical protein